MRKALLSLALLFLIASCSTTAAKPETLKVNCSERPERILIGIYTDVNGKTYPTWLCLIKRSKKKMTTLKKMIEDNTYSDGSKIEIDRQDIPKFNHLVNELYEVIENLKQQVRDLE